MFIEVINMNYLQQLLGFETERAFLAFASGNLRHLFPRLLNPSQFNRRVRAAARGPWSSSAVRRSRSWELAASATV